MNANEIAPKANLRLNRIKIVSRIVKYAILGFFVISIGVFLQLSLPTWHLETMKMYPIWFGFVNLPQVVLWVWYWKLARLFDFYERGLIFATATIRCIKKLGILCVVNWLLYTAYDVWERFVPSSHVQGGTIKLPKPPVVEHVFKMGFFNFSVAGISFGLLLAGAVIAIIAWIMDEGRKIQEEQELTV